MSNAALKEEPEGAGSRILLVAVAFLLVLLVAFLLYQPALSGSFHFDDAPNLSGLGGVRDFTGSISFVFDGSAGPLGRPLALISFLPQADAWPDDPKPFLFINLLIHLCNGALVAALTYQMAQALGARIARPRIFALTVSALWLILPINAPASLQVIQPA